MCSAKKLDKGQDILFSALLTSPTQSVTCHVMCDDIAGTLREATLQPKIPASAFPDPRPCSKDTSHDKSKSGTGKPSMNTSRPRSVHVHAPASAPSNSRRAGSDDFVDNDLDDADLMQAENDVDDFRDIEDIEDDIEAPSRSNPVRNSSEANAASPSAKRVLADQDLGPKRRANGNWECNHQCKDKTKCSHLCCRDGMKKKPKAPKSKAPGATQQTATQGNPQKATKAPSRTSKTQSTLKAHVTKPVTAPVCSPQSPIAQIDLSHNGGRKAGRKTASPVPNPPDLKRLQSLHSKSQKRAPPSSITSVSRKRPQYSYASGTAPSLSFLPIKKPEVENPPSSDYGDAEMDDLPSALDFDVEVFMKDTRMDDAGIVPFEEELYEETDSVLEDAMVGLADSQDIITAHIASQPQARTSNRVTPGTTRDGSLRSYATDPMKEADSVQTSKYPERVAVAPSKEKTLFVTGDSSSSPVPDAARVSSNASEHSEGKLLKRVAERTSTPFQARPSKRFKGQAVELQGTHLDNENVAPPAEPMKESGNADGLGPDIPEKDSTDQSQADSLDSWFLREFGDIVEIV